MGRAPCCDKANVKKGPWSPEEDKQLKEYIEKHGTGGNWIALPHKAGLKRCGKSCRLRWLNYLRPNIKHGDFSDDEDRIICNLYSSIGSRWSIIAAQLPGRTDNDIKNYWNTKLKKKLLGIPPAQRKPENQQQHNKHHHQQQLYPSLQHAAAGGAATAAAPFPSPPGLEGIALPPYLLSSLLNSSPLPLNPKGPTNQAAGNFIMFGGSDQSCSSSDASSTRISYGRDMDHDLYTAAGEQMAGLGAFENYLYGGLEETQKHLLGGGAAGGEQAPLLFNYEDVKPHNGASNINNNNNNGCSSLFLEDQSSGTKEINFKTPAGRPMYYC